jgi:hypothetical protein
MTTPFSLQFIMHAVFCEQCITYLAPRERREELKAPNPFWRCWRGRELAELAEKECE